MTIVVNLQFWTPQYHPPKANKFIGATGQADFYGYTRFIVCCMWFVGYPSTIFLKGKILGILQISLSLIYVFCLFFFREPDLFRFGIIGGRKLRPQDFKLIFYQFKHKVVGKSFEDENQTVIESDLVL
jgi:hypothetical protein